MAHSEEKFGRHQRPAPKIKYEKQPSSPRQQHPTPTPPPHQPSPSPPPSFRRDSGPRQDFQKATRSQPPAVATKQAGKASPQPTKPPKQVDQVKHQKAKKKTTPKSNQPEPKISAVDNQYTQETPRSEMKTDLGQLNLANQGFDRGKTTQSKPETPRSEMQKISADLGQLNLASQGFDRGKTTQQSNVEAQPENAEKHGELVQIREGCWFVQREGRRVQLGRGASGEVFEGRWDRGDGTVQAVAIKEVLVSEHEQKRIEGINREINVLRRQENTEFIVKCETSFWIQLTPQLRHAYLVLEKMDGDLDQIHVGRLGEITGAQWKSVLRGLLTGLKLLHQNGVYLRDVKPANMLVRWEAGKSTPRVKLCDADKSRTFDSIHTAAGMTAIKTNGWSHRLLSFGQVEGRAALAACDLFSLGLVFFYILSAGRHLYQAPVDLSCCCIGCRPAGEARALMGTLQSAIEDRKRDNRRPRNQLYANSQALSPQEPPYAVELILAMTSHFDNKNAEQFPDATRLLQHPYFRENNADLDGVVLAYSADGEKAFSLMRLLRKDKGQHNDAFYPTRSWLASEEMKALVALMAAENHGTYGDTLAEFLRLYANLLRHSHEKSAQLSAIIPQMHIHRFFESRFPNLWPYLWALEGPYLIEIAKSLAQRPPFDWAVPLN